MIATSDIIETTLTLNGESVTRRIPVRQNLVDFLRENMGLTGTHIGCEHGVCGACTVRVDGKIVRGSSELQIDEEVKLTFARGWARARVKDKGRD